MVHSVRVVRKLCAVFFLEHTLDISGRCCRVSVITRTQMENMASMTHCMDDGIPLPISAMSVNCRPTGTEMVKTETV